LKKDKATIALMLFLCFTLVCFLDFYSLEANAFTYIPLPEPAFTIKSDGSVDPPTAPIHRDGDVYTLTDDIVGYSIIVQKDEVTIDGGGYTLKGYGSEGNFSLKGYESPTGILLLDQNGVTVRNMKISGFSYGIKVTGLFSHACTNNILENNLVTDNYYGVYMSSSWFTVLRNNHMSNNICNFYVYDLISLLPPNPNLYMNDIDSSNTVDGKPIIYWVNEQDKTVPSDAGYVAIVNCTNMTVQNLDLADNGQGIMLISTTNSIITRNHVTNTDWGIFAHNSSNIVITENNLESNNVGLSVHRLSNSSISINNFTQNGGGVSLVTSHNNVFSGNNITHNTGNGVQLSGFDNNTIEQNIIAENVNDGLDVYSSCNNTIAGNTIANNGYYGVQIWRDSSGNEISKNLITNHRIGVLIRGCVNNTIIGNLIAENQDWGLHLAEGSRNNVIYSNNFFHNQQEGGTQVLVTSTIDRTAITERGGLNMWDNGTAGNYWSDYKGTDSDGDGIGDVPFHINNDNIDHNPLMEPIEIPEFPTNFHIPEFPSWLILPLFFVSTLALFLAKKRIKFGASRNE
jgi:parallel beta-helix repeat protein